MELLRRISGSSTSSADDGPFRRSLSLGPFRRKSSKDSGRSIRRALKDQIREFNANPQNAYTSAPQSPLLKSRAGSFPDELSPDEESLAIPRSTKTSPTRLYSHPNDSTSNKSEEDLPLGIAFTGLSPRRESTLSIPFKLPKLTKNRRISEHIDPMSMPTTSSAISIPRSINWARRKSEAVKFFEEDEEQDEGEQENESIVQKDNSKLERQMNKIVPRVSVLPDAHAIYSANSSYSTHYKDLEARDSIVSFVTSNSSAPSPTGRPSTSPGAINTTRKILPYIPDDESYSYDLLPPGQSAIDPRQRSSATRIEELSQKLHSKEHLRMITSDPKILHSFSRFIEWYRPPESMTLLTYYLDAQKAIKAINYANAIAESLGPSPAPNRSWIQLEHEGITPINKILEQKASDAFKVLTEQELPRYISWVYSEIVSFNIQKKITGNEMLYMEDNANELAEVFCLTDPQQLDNPIIFASEEFHRTTQYPISYVSGRNCRFLQGPKTQRTSITRIREAVKHGREVTECFLNYKRDGTPFLNLVMIAPLLDAKGQIRYFLGAQVDVTSLAKNHIGLEGFKRLMNKQRKQSEVVAGTGLDLDLVRPKLEEFKRLSELFSAEEIENVRQNGGQLHKDHKINRSTPDVNLIDSNSSTTSQIETLVPSLSFEDEAGDGTKKATKSKKVANFWNSSLKGVYRNYILVRPHPSHRILFASPSMRTPGILQSPLMSKIGGTDRVREELDRALSNGRGITVKVRWLSKAEEQNPKKTEFDGRERWLHCTPLFGSNGGIGVWVIVIVDDDSNPEPAPHPEYEVSNLIGLDLGVEKRPASGGSDKSFQLSTDINGVIASGNYCSWSPRKPRDAPVIQNPEEWRNSAGKQDWEFEPDSGVDEPVSRASS
ncbi:hypothetical protein TWF694_006530 [Orbilia ellipsospora]|uniref:PAC domain-containing protein n=1 Tax=Orbilia ellipsospora TaxID=2528407 RepID=A0AAV9XKU3_9PEZI